MKITGTFLDEISHDINHQNWGELEWDSDFKSMKEVGIDTVILIRSGYKKWLTFPSRVLQTKENCYKPSTDLVDLFLRLAEKYQMNFYFGLYDSGKYWVNGLCREEMQLNREVIQEVLEKYGNRSAFKGWYFSHEINRLDLGIVNEYAELGSFLKKNSSLPVMISPYIDGKKAVLASNHALEKDKSITLEEHRQEWDQILNTVSGSIDIMAFQDGHVEFDELYDFMKVNKELSDKYGIQGWTNCESFDRDMPIKFLPIKWEKMRMKLEIAKRVGVDKAITFEFSHFMSPNSSYPQARHLFNRYKEYISNEL